MAATPIKDFFSSFMLTELFKGMRLTGRHFLSKKMSRYPHTIRVGTSSFFRAG